MNDMADSLLPPLRRAHSRVHDRESSILSVIITKVGNFGVQMNYQAISVALIVMSVDVCTKNDDECREGEQQMWVLSSATAAVFAGSIVGQLAMGYAGDVFGRTTAMGLTQFIAVLSALFSALIPMGNAEQVYSTIIVCRFFLGIGLGGTYPLAATKAAEDASAGGTNPTASAKSFFWQTPGSLAPWFLALLFTTIDLSANLKWRLLLGLGAIPGIVVFWCVMLENHERYSITHKASVDVKSFSRKESMVAENVLHTSQNWYKLIGTGGSWFIFDVCYYGVGLFGGEILSAMADEDDDNITTNRHMVDTSWKQIVALGTGIPAIVATIVLMPYISLKYLQIAGFFATAIGFLIMAVCFFPLKKHYPNLLFAIYCFLLFALQFGPNVTTYVLPSVVYPKTVRSTMTGFSAAAGKLGAVAGAYIFGAVATATSFPAVMVLCAVLALVGIIITHYFIDEPEYNHLSEDTDDVDTKDAIDNSLCGLIADSD